MLLLSLKNIELMLFPDKSRLVKLGGSWFIYAKNILFYYITNKKKIKRKKLNKILIKKIENITNIIVL